ncbi:hypothetical protein CTI12_AA520170 [Artemisia annua]|uniref:Uncharacterized protein n=1 Tax=Artemisia annua TaxID=35608 RepID=A0A2U1L8E6_ARTAN|nr:hypothetical protein CTI12_AA520170 [Artemisia annua]
MSIPQGQFQVFSSTNTQVDMASHVQDQFVTQMVHNSAFLHHRMLMWLWKMSLMENLIW